MWELFVSRKVRIAIVYHFCCGLVLLREHVDMGISNLKGPIFFSGRSDLLECCFNSVTMGPITKMFIPKALLIEFRLEEDHNNLHPDLTMNISKTFDDAPNRVTVARVEYPNLYIPFWPYRTWAWFFDRLRWEVAMICESLEVNQVCWLGMAMRLTCVYRCTYV